jgi:hypothetical protein
MESNRPTEPVVGAIPGAKLEFQGAGDPVEVTTAATGRFRVLLPPGSYKVRMRADGYAEATAELSVGARKEPIWEERARLVTPEQAEDETHFDGVMKKL